ncbi:MAG: hypothetical protein V3T77_04060 [Planctomycetota bacterium]
MGVISSLFQRKKPYRKLLQSGNVDEILASAQWMLEQQQLERALELLRSGQKRFPDNNLLRRKCQDVEHFLTRAAIEAAERELTQEASTELLARLCDLHRHSGDMDKALDYGRRVILLDPRSVIGYRSVGRIYYEQFLAEQGSAQGMNALRYLSKAHSLDRSNSTCLLQLAEIFLIMHAPTAALMFLSPVQKAFPENYQVQKLVSWARELPPEDTTQIQDLFLRHESRLSGELSEPQVPVNLSEEVVLEVENLLERIAGTEGIYLIDGTRSIVSGRSRCGWSEPDVAAAFGLLADTARQCCPRMGIGRFTRLDVNCANRTMVVKSAADNLTAFFVGDHSLNKEDADAALEIICDQVAQESRGLAR